MKRFRIKVFLTIFIILSVFTTSIFIVTTTRDYYEKKNSVVSILENRPELGSPKDLEEKPEPKGDEPRKVFMDHKVYTVILDENGKFKEIINNTNSDDIDEEEIKDIAEDIIEDHKSSTYIGNLYKEEYSYSFTSNNNLIIIDNEEVNKTLKKELVTNITLFITAELIALVITSSLTKWIIKPVEEAFTKQKRFIEDASHELKTPLAVILASSDAYFNNKNDKWVRNIKNESIRMSNLVKDLLDLAKLENKKELFNEENLSDIVESMVLTFESMFYENNLKLDYNIEKDIKLKCNIDEIKNLLSILIDNSIKHSIKNGDISINLKRNNKEIKLTVKNKGNPIKKEDEEKIFERFYKIDASRNRDDNTYGLGLAIAKEIVEKTKGKISAKSNKGYTTFTVIWNQK